jgi:hypothetical protein
LATEGFSAMMRVLVINPFSCDGWRDASSVTMDSDQAGVLLLLWIETDPRSARANRQASDNLAISGQ